MDRKTFRHGELTFSWLDAGGNGDLLIALHAHWMEGATFRRLAADLAPRYRVVALDQRGHGDSDHAATYSREDYLGDLDAFVAELHPDRPFAMLGNSLGGINALQYAARHPERVRGFILEDIGTEVDTNIDFVRAWGGVFATREALEERIGSRMVPYLENSFRRTDGGWRLAFDPEDMIRSQAALNGNYRSDWLATTCPVLVIRASESKVTTREQLERMVGERPNTTLRELDGSHAIHQDRPVEVANLVTEFLDALER